MAAVAGEGEKMLRCPDWESTTAQDIIEKASAIDTSVDGWDDPLIDVVVEGLNKKLSAVAMTPMYKIIQTWWAKQASSSNWSVIAPWMLPATTTAQTKLVSLRRLAIAMMNYTDPQQAHGNDVKRIDIAQKALQLSFENL